jgi:hypothetical protein
LIPEDAVAAVVVRNLNDLKKKGDRFVADAQGGRSGVQRFVRRNHYSLVFALSSFVLQRLDIARLSLHSLFSTRRHRSTLLVCS